MKEKKKQWDFRGKNKTNYVGQDKYGPLKYCLTYIVKLCVHLDCHLGNVILRWSFQNDYFQMLPLFSTFISFENLNFYT